MKHFFLVTPLYLLFLFTFSVFALEQTSSTSTPTTTSTTTSSPVALGRPKAIERLPCQEHSMVVAHGTFDEAINDKNNFITFKGSSTKLGLLTSSFTGVAKNFTLTYCASKNNEEISEVKLEIVAGSFDTDSENRNEKMKSLCLKVVDFPHINGFLDPMGQNSEENPSTNYLRIKNAPKGKVPFRLKLLGKPTTVGLDYEANEHNDSSEKKLVVSVRGVLSLKNAEIADPSILVAHVKDEIELEAQFTLPVY